MKFSDLKYCPFCGGSEYYTIEYFFGKVSPLQRFDGKKTSAAKIYDSIANRYGVNVYCFSCRRYLGDFVRNTVGSLAAKAVSKSEGV